MWLLFVTLEHFWKGFLIDKGLNVAWCWAPFNCSIQLRIECLDLARSQLEDFLCGAVLLRVIYSLF